MYNADGENNKEGLFIPPSFFSSAWPKEMIPQLKNKIIDTIDAKGGESLIFNKTISASKDIFPLLDLKPTDTIVDVGSGTGGFEILLLSMRISFARVIAVDIDEASVDLMQFMLNHLNYPDKDKIVTKVSSCKDLLLDDESADVAIISNSPMLYLDHGKEISTPGKCLSRVHRLLKRNGKLHVLHEMTPQTDRAEDERIIPLFKSIGFKNIHDKHVQFRYPETDDISETRYFIFTKQ